MVNLGSKLNLPKILKEFINIYMLLYSRSKERRLRRPLRSTFSVDVFWMMGKGHS